MTPFFPSDQFIAGVWARFPLYTIQSDGYARFPSPIRVRVACTLTHSIPLKSRGFCPFCLGFSPRKQTPFFLRRYAPAAAAAGTQCGAEFTAGKGVSNSSLTGVAEPGVVAIACLHGVVQHMLCMPPGNGEKYVYSLHTPHNVLCALTARFRSFGGWFDWLVHLTHSDNSCAAFPL